MTLRASLLLSIMHTQRQNLLQWTIQPLSTATLDIRAMITASWMCDHCHGKAVSQTYKRCTIIRIINQPNYPTHNPIRPLLLLPTMSTITFPGVRSARVGVMNSTLQSLGTHSRLSIIFLLLLLKKSNTSPILISSSIQVIRREVTNILRVDLDQVINLLVIITDPHSKDNIEILTSTARPCSSS